MSATGKLTVTELEARFESGGIEAVRDYYKDCPVLVVFPDERGGNSITWTPHSTGGLPIQPKAATPDSGESVEEFALVPSLPLGAVVTPIRGFTVGESLILVGRDNSCAVKFEDTSVSRFHATFDRSDGYWGLIDLDSHNGTWIDGLRLESGRRYYVTPYKEIKFGSVSMMFLDCESLVDVCQLNDK